jgi:hypothetical protein
MSIVDNCFQRVELFSGGKFGVFDRTMVNSQGQGQGHSFKQTNDLRKTQQPTQFCDKGDGDTRRRADSSRRPRQLPKAGLAAAGSAATEKSKSTRSKVTSSGKAECSTLSLPPLPHNFSTMHIVNFPRKLFEIVRYTTSNPAHSNSTILTWHPESSPSSLTEYNHMFVIWDKNEFMTRLAPRFFPTQNSFRSLERTLNAWNFVRDSPEESQLFLKRSSKVPLKNMRVYSNPYFLRHDPSMARHIERRKNETSSIHGSSTIPPHQLAPLLPKSASLRIVPFIPPPITPAVAIGATAPLTSTTPTCTYESYHNPEFASYHRVHSKQPRDSQLPVYQFLRRPSHHTTTNVAATSSVRSTHQLSQSRETTRPTKRPLSLSISSRSSTTKRTCTLPVASPWSRGSRTVSTHDKLGSLLQRTTFEEMPNLCLRQSQFADVKEKAIESHRSDDEDDSEVETDCEDDLVF